MKSSRVKKYPLEFNDEWFQMKLIILEMIVIIKVVMWICEFNDEYYWNNLSNEIIYEMIVIHDRIMNYYL